MSNNSTVMIEVPAKDVLVTGQHPISRHIVLTAEWAAVKRAEWLIGMASHRHAKAFGDDREQLFEVVFAGDAAGRQIRSERKDEDRLHYFDDWAPLELRCLLDRRSQELRKIFQRSRRKCCGTLLSVLNCREKFRNLDGVRWLQQVAIKSCF